MKKSLPLTVLLAALALIGCGKTSEASMASADASFVEGTKTSAKPIGDTETTSEAASAKESVAPVVHTVDLKAFLAGLGSHSLTLESDSGTLNFITTMPSRVLPPMIRAKNPRSVLSMCRAKARFYSMSMVTRLN
jgi:hypothetical protein